MVRYPHGNPSDIQRRIASGVIASLLTCLALVTGVAWATPQPGLRATFELHATNGTHMAEATERTTLVEEVALPEGYEPGDYELSVTLHLRNADGSDAGVLMVSDVEVTTGATLSPIGEGKLSLPVTFDARGLEGKSVVAFATIAKDGSVVARSEDITNGAQTVRLPKVETSLSDKDGEIELAGQEGMELTAKACWSNVDPDSSPRVLVTLADADSGETLRNTEGREVTTITPVPQDKDGKVEESGSVETRLTIDGNTHSGKRIAAKARLLCGSESVASGGPSGAKGVVSIPSITSTATGGGTEIPLAMASDETTVTDDIAYEALTPGTTYVLSGELVDAKTGKPLTVFDGNTREDTTATREVTSTEASGTAELTYAFDARDLAGSTVATRTTLTRKSDGKRLATTSDDSVRIPRMRAEVTGGRSGAKCELADTEASAKVTLSYENLEHDGEYIAWATAHLTGTDSHGDTTDEGTLKDAEGSEATTSTSFSPEDEDGTLKLTLPFDGSSLEGRRVSVITGISRNETDVATCDDLSDDSHALWFPKVATRDLASEGGLDELLAGAASTIEATVSYERLPKGTYTATLALVDPETGERVGDRSADVRLHSTGADGSVNLTWQLDTTGLKGRTLAAVTYVRTGDAVVAADYGSATLHAPAISSTLHEAEGGSSIALAQKETALVGNTSFENVTTGTTHTLRGRLLDAETGDELKDADGKPVTGSATISPGTAQGTAEVTFKLDARRLAGRSVSTAFELTQGDTVVARCENATDGSGDVRFPLLNASVASEASKDHELPADGKQKVTCKLSHENVIPDTAYTLRASLVDAETGDEVKVGNDPIAAEVEVTPMESSGQAEVALDCGDTASLAGRTLAVIASMTLDGRTVGLADDRTNEDQRLHVPSIATELHAQDGTHEIGADKDQRLTDTIIYANLTPGVEYTIEGELVDATTGKPTVRNANQEGDQGTAQRMTAITSKASDADKAKDAFEGKPDVTEVWVTDDSTYHLDKSCESARGTTRHATLGIAKIAGKKPCAKESGTETEDTDTAGTVTASTPATSGTSRNTTKGEEVPVTARATFTPTEPSGTTEVEFTLDATGLDGRRLVALEVLTRDGRIVATHQDTGDDRQTVTVTGAPTTSGGGHPSESMGQTGAGGTLVVAAGVGVLLAVAGAILLVWHGGIDEDGGEDGHEGRH